MTARQAGMQPDIIVDAWRRTGHYPFNPDIFTEMDYAPSKITSTSTHLPPSFPTAPFTFVELDQPGSQSFVFPADGLISSQDENTSECPPTSPGVNQPTPVGQVQNGPAPTPVATARDLIPIDPALIADGNTIPVGDFVALNPSEPSLSLGQVSSGEPEHEQIPIQLPAVPPSQLLRSQFIGSRQGLRLKDQAVKQEKELEVLWQNLVQVNKYAQNAHTHLVLLKRQYEDLRRQLDAQNKPKRTSAEAAAMSKIQKYRFLTNPEMREAFEKALGEEEAKRVVEADKAARKEAKAKDIEGKRSLIIADQTYAFDGTFQSYKTKNLEWLGDLAACLGVPFANSKRSEIFDKISTHFDDHPELKALPRYSKMFNTARVSQRAANFGSSIVEIEGPVSTSFGADFPPVPPSLPGPLIS